MRGGEHLPATPPPVPADLFPDPLRERLKKRAERRSDNGAAGAADDRVYPAVGRGGGSLLVPGPALAGVLAPPCRCSRRNSTKRGRRTPGQRPLLGGFLCHFGRCGGRAFSALP